MREDTEEYRKWYNKGWRYSLTTTTGSLDYGDAQGFPDSWYDGYLDAAAGREKWHRLFCPDHDLCP